MKAIVNTEYGSPDVLKFQEVDKPTPKDGEALVKVYAAGLNAADWHLMRGEPFVARLMFGLFKPKHHILGADVAGVVEAVGKNVTQFKPGDEVFGDLSAGSFGAFAEYVCAKEKALLLKPTNLSFEEAAVVPMSACTALQGLRTVGGIKAEQKVLINGASGGVGTYAVQIAKSFGAEVTAVCSTKNVETARALGADFVIDYTKEDFTKNGKNYDLILGANGFHSLSDYKRALSPQGTYVMSGGENAQLFQALFMGPFMSKSGGKKIKNVMAKPNREDLTFIKQLIETGKLKPVIDRSYTLAEVPDAIRYLEEGHAKGKISIKVRQT